MVDPLLLVHSLVISENVDMAISKHPYFVHTLEEAMAVARRKKWWDVNALRPTCTDHEEAWTELEAFNWRDQLAFAFVHETQAEGEHALC
ncbi:hypothetical protein VNO78_10981 [Psophocarpus tetragonolobus]|uniref:TOD1/MUCI70 glycosyltransferase-like domain-containing protein n=1 Tax=Psophocarpus tetragonolobus TaxID=3891 RepID=A0AAN9XN79_PSOTE